MAIGSYRPSRQWHVQETTGANGSSIVEFAGGIRSESRTVHFRHIADGPVNKVELSVAQGEAYAGGLIGQYVRIGKPGKFTIGVSFDDKLNIVSVAVTDGKTQIFRPKDNPRAAIFVKAKKLVTFRFSARKTEGTRTSDCQKLFALGNEIHKQAQRMQK